MKKKNKISDAIICPQDSYAHGFHKTCFLMRFSTEVSRNQGETR